VGISWQLGLRNTPACGKSKRVLTPFAARRLTLSVAPRKLASQPLSRAPNNMLPTDSLSAFALAALIALLITYLLMRRKPAKNRARSTRNDALDTVADWPPEAARVMTTPERKAFETVRRALPQQVGLSQV